MIPRREFIALVGGAAVGWPFAARGQQGVKPVVGLLLTATREGFEPYTSTVLEGLKETGFVEGRNLAVEYRFANDHYDRLSGLAADLIEHQAAVIVTDPRGVYAARALTKTIPIVFVSGSDPVRKGLVASLNRPGGNLTGVTFLANDLTAKRFALFHDLIPQGALIGVLSDSTSPGAEFAVQEVQAAARNIGVTIRMIPVGTESELESAFATFASEGIGTVFATNGFFFFSFCDRLNDLASRYRMPLSGDLRKFADGGALMSYGPNLVDAYRRVGVYAGRILKGEKPADLPVEQPTKFELIINLKTAKTLGLTVPPSLLATADEVIE